MKLNLLLVFMFIMGLVYGETYDKLYFEQLNNNDGLISDEVNFSFQDSHGFMWFATSEGIVRYDGYEFNTFKYHPYLGCLYGSEVFLITSCKDGNLYVCSEKGLFVFTEKFEPAHVFATTVLKGLTVLGLLEASDGRIYVTTSKGLYIISPEQQEIRLVEGLSNQNIFTRAIVEDANGNIWLGSWGKGLLKLNENKDGFQSFTMFKSITKGTADNNINSLFIDSNGFLWLGVWEGGIYIMDIVSNNEPQVIKSFVHDADDDNCIPGNIVHSIFEDQYNSIWLGTPYGAAVIRYPFARNSRIYKYSFKKEEGRISSNVVRHIYRDNSNLIWLATKGGGINKVYIERNKFDYYPIPDLDPQKITQAAHAFIKDHKGRLLVGVLHLGFIVYDSKTQRWFNFKDLPFYKEIARKVELNTVNSFLWDNDSVLWLGTRYNGIVTLDPKGGNVSLINSSSHPNEFRGRLVNTQFLDSDGSVWVGTSACLVHVNPFNRNKPDVKGVEFFNQENNPIKSVNVTGIVRNLNGTILVTTYLNGIFEIQKRGNSYQAYPLKGVDVREKIMTCYYDEGGRLWLGTKGNGMMYVEKNTQELKSPLPDVHLYGDVVFGIAQDEYGSMWLTSNMGLIKLWFQQGDVKTERFLHRDGLQGNIFIPRSIYKDKSGLLYVGGYNGFNIFNPLKINGNYSKAPIVIAELLVEGERYPYFNTPGDVLRLNHVKNDFTATFSALDYIDSEANQYAYILEGIDKEWKYVNSKMRSINYSNLLAGEYVLKVKGSNNQGIWNEDYLELPIVVSPAPYKTGWAITLYIFLITGIAIFLLNQRRKVGRIKQKYELELISKEKAKNLNEYKLRFFTNISHELLTPLSILSSVSENSMRKKVYSFEDNLIIQRNVHNLTRLIRQLLTFRKLESGNMSLKLEKGDISEFVSKAIADFKVLANSRSMHFSTDIDQNITGLFDREKIEIILHNLLSNAFKYTNDGGTVACSLLWEKPTQTIQLKVTDDGEGISEQAMSKLFTRFDRGDKEGKGGIGIGLNLTKTLVEILNGKIEVQSSVGVGSTFKVILPVVSELFISTGQKLENDEISVSTEAAASVDADDKTLVMHDFSERDYNILLVEDNDDFRKVLKESLSDYFNVLEASDGLEALEIANENNVDLIVSDVMMPNMTGKELCMKVKSDINLSHIPVILLTAKAGTENKLAGYEAGADAYLEKPVELEMLLIRIRNLIKQREKFKTVVNSMEIDLEPVKVAVTPQDQKFVLDAKELVEKNLSDPDFTVKTLSAELNVTSSMLYRKIKSLAGLPPNEFIRSIRLRRAAQMFRNKSFTISEVAFNCGFNDLGYFGVCFKKMFGKTPTEYQNEMAKEQE